LIALDTFASQRAFRVLLAAFAAPGRVQPVWGRLPDDTPPALVVPLALADLSQSVAVVGPGADRWAAGVAAATGCRVLSPPEADLVVALGEATPALVTSLRRGDALAPERGCRFTLACRTVGRGPVRLTLSGPGIADRTVVRVDGPTAEVFVALGVANRAFPAGIDTLLIDEDGHVVGIPRSSTVTVEV
jgi:alpha-D-ribose 1-methylphosphonate 5-triphosphate synthase subunit PhnH